MKKYYVYEIRNSLGIVEYVGETANPKERFGRHVWRRPCLTKKGNVSNGVGGFYGRTDVSLNIVKEFDNRKDAFNYQCELQKEYGFKTDSEKQADKFRGKVHSDETKLKMSLAKIKK
jgi:predicted GIY-YIG superfamily endonuclease